MYERDEAPGGLNRFGVPDQKLPKEVIDRRITLMEAEGVVVRCGVDVGVDVDPQELRGSTDALVVATGARVERELDVPGSDLRGVHPAMEYLYARNRAVAAGRTAQCPPPSVAGRTVVVIGAGDTSADCMSNAIREGARSVVQLDTYPAPTGTRPREIAGWPRSPRRSPTHYALDEGGGRESAVEVTELHGRDGHVCAVEGTQVQPPPSRRTVAGTPFTRDAPRARGHRVHRATARTTRRAGNRARRAGPRSRHRSTPPLRRASSWPGTPTSAPASPSPPSTRGCAARAPSTAGWLAERVTAGGGPRKGSPDRPPDSVSRSPGRPAAFSSRRRPARQGMLGHPPRRARARAARRARARGADRR